MERLCLLWDHIDDWLSVALQICARELGLADPVWLMISAAVFIRRLR